MTSSGGGTIFYPAFACCIIGILVAVCKMLYRKELRNRAQQVSVKTREPVVPGWLRNQKNISKLLLPNIMIQCRPYTPEYKKKNSQQTERAMEAIEWTQALVNSKVPRVTVPKDAATVSVPMKSFKNGSLPTDFKPISGEVPGSYYTYHMIGEQKIQVTTYWEGGVAYTAGFCVYINSPYEKRIHYRRALLEGYCSGPKYFAMSTIDSRDPEQVTKDILEELKLTFCTKIQRPVMIGIDDGKTKHFDWCVTSETFKMSECTSCKAKKVVDDNPPSYSSLNFQKV